MNFFTKLRFSLNSGFPKQQLDPSSNVAKSLHFFSKTEDDKSICKIGGEIHQQLITLYSQPVHMLVDWYDLTNQGNEAKNLGKNNPFVDILQFCIYSFWSLGVCEGQSPISKL